MITAKSEVNYNHEKEENTETISFTYHREDREFMNEVIRPMIQLLLDNHNRNVSTIANKRLKEENDTLKKEIKAKDEIIEMYYEMVKMND